MKRVSLLILILSIVSMSFATKIRNGGKSPFVIVNSKGFTSTICFDKNDDIVIGRVARLFSEDVNRVSGLSLPITNNLDKNEGVILVGTIGKCEYINQLAVRGLIDLSPLQNSWERYIIQIIEKPFPGIKKALVIAGSDRRGAAYGLLSISEEIGVSPWYWWADIPIKNNRVLTYNKSYLLSQEPTVKYRGIFLNDEDWGLLPWASKNFEKERGNIGPKTYARICELLLRLKANYLAPAMHPVSTAFNQIPENKLVADSFAIVMGSTHCEPLLFNTASEWDKKTMGDWDLRKNRNGIYNVLSKRVKDNASFENIYTLALRGIHDEAMGIGLSMKEKVKILSNALADQRKILKEQINLPIEQIPQAFTPYKEVLDVYSSGLELPEDITIVWPDDNYGYMKQLSGYTEQKRSGRSGVYYHVSYLGVPHSYLWFSTTPPALMYEELKKAYDTTADRIWLLNCGDLKGAEMQINLFLEMAYDINKFNSENVVDYPARWLSMMFGNKYYESFKRIMYKHYALAFSHKPEYMGWGYHWNKFDSPCEILTDTEYSFIHYNEAEKRITDYINIGSAAEELFHSVSDEYKPALYQLLYYPVKGAELLNRMTLVAQKNRWYARQQRVQTNLLSERVRLCYDSLQIITNEYNKMLNGKWKYMMSMRQNYDNVSAYFNLPELHEYIPTEDFKFNIQVEGQDFSLGSSRVYVLPCFNVYLPDSHWIDIYNQGKKELIWNANVSAPWIKLSSYNGIVSEEQRIEVSLDWKNVPESDDILEYIDICVRGVTKRIWVSVYNKYVGENIQGYFLENNGYVSIPTSDFHRKHENKEIQMKVIDGLGVEKKSLQLGNPISPLQIFRSPTVPYVEYDFYSFSAGLVDVYTYVLPTFPLHKERDFKLPETTNTDTKYSLCIDNGALATPSTSSVEYSQRWFEGVLCNCRVNKSTLYVDKPGKHVLQIRCGDPGVVLQKVVLDFGGLKRSLLGPPSTQIRK